MVEYAFILVLVAMVVLVSVVVLGKQTEQPLLEHLERPRYLSVSAQPATQRPNRPLRRLRSPLSGAAAAAMARSGTIAATSSRTARLTSASGCAVTNGTPRVMASPMTRGSCGICTATGAAQALLDRLLVEVRVAVDAVDHQHRSSSGSTDSDFEHLEGELGVLDGRDGQRGDHQHPLGQLDDLEVELGEVAGAVDDDVVERAAQLGDHARARARR